jgi:hypothetical protein
MDHHSKKLHQLKKKAASTCVGGVLSSHDFFDALDSLRKPYKKSPELGAERDKKSRDNERTDTSAAESIEDDGVSGPTQDSGKDSAPNEQDNISSISHLLDIDKFDMLERPKTEKKWGKLSKAVKEKAVAVPAVKVKDPIETVDPTDLMLFYYFKHRNIVW